MDTLNCPICTAELTNKDLVGLWTYRCWGCGYNMNVKPTMQWFKDLDENQWAWIIIQAIITICFLLSPGDGNGANWARAIIFNLGVLFMIMITLTTWGDK